MISGSQSRLLIMDFRLSSEERPAPKEQFVRDELVPLEPESCTRRTSLKEPVEKPREVEPRSRDSSLYRTHGRPGEESGSRRSLVSRRSREYGGLDVSNVAMIAVTEELEKTSIPFELGNHVSNILYSCRGEQIDRFLLPCIRGEKTSAFGLSEPASGADPSMLQTTAMPDGDDFIINGTKMFPTFADVADFVQLFARLPGTKGREGVTCFLIDTGTPGYRVVRSIATIAGTEPCELIFEDCRVPKTPGARRGGQRLGAQPGVAGREKISGRHSFPWHVAAGLAVCGGVVAP